MVVTARPLLSVICGLTNLLLVSVFAGHQDGQHWYERGLPMPSALQNRQMSSALGTRLTLPCLLAKWALSAAENTGPHPFITLYQNIVYIFQTSALVVSVFATHRRTYLYKPVRIPLGVWLFCCNGAWSLSRNAAVVNIITLQWSHLWDYSRKEWIESQEQWYRQDK